MKDINNMKKLVLLSSAESTHTIRWANSLSKHNFEVMLISQHSLKQTLNSTVHFRKLRYEGEKGYFLNTMELKKLVDDFEPDFIHAHFASGYGTLAKNIGRPYFLSVWGSDVYDFPSNKLKKFLLERAINGAEKLFSTSECMKQQTAKFTNKKIEVIPFGVDVETFSPISGKKNVFTIGIVKVIDHKYGIDTLLHAFSILRERTDMSIHLKIIGDGPQLKQMKDLAQKLNINEDVSFLGWVDNIKLPEILNSFNVFVVPSRLDSESFGVAAVEAGACELPCVVTNVGGLPEVVIDKKTGLVVNKESPAELAEAIHYILGNPNEASIMGRNARENVLEKYNWRDNVSKMVSFYEGAK